MNQKETTKNQKGLFSPPGIPHPLWHEGRERERRHDREGGERGRERRVQEKVTEREK